MTDLRGHRVVQIDVPSELEFHLSDNATEVSGRYGILDQAHVQGKTDGAEFIVELVDADGSRSRIGRWLLQPRERIEDAGLKEFRLRLPAGKGRRLLLRTAPGPASDLSWDWTCWADVVIH
ncbi:hypothetical protein EBR04_08065, partial [bacterium]|nr:hypothetical protein [bacterium]